MVVADEVVRSVSDAESRRSRVWVCKGGQGVRADLRFVSLSPLFFFYPRPFLAL